MEPNKILKYDDAEDKCFGVVGMTIALLMHDCQDYIVNVSIDNTDIDSVIFSPDFNIISDPDFSAKSHWKHLLHRLQLSSSLLIANVMCRNYVHFFKSVSRAQVDEMMRLFAEEGADLCQLDRDETDALFMREFNELDRAFRDRRVHDIATSMVRRLLEHHTLSRNEILEIFGA